MSRFLFVLFRRGNAKSLRQRLIDRTRQRRHVRKAGEVDQPLCRSKAPSTAFLGWGVGISVR